MSSEQADIEALRGQITFGLDVEQFMRSDMGRYLTQRANQERDSCLEALGNVDAENPKEIRRLQNELRCAERFLLWMGEAVSAGENAQAAYVEQDG